MDLTPSELSLVHPRWCCVEGRFIITFHAHHMDCCSTVMVCVCVDLTPCELSLVHSRWCCVEGHFTITYPVMHKDCQLTLRRNLDREQTKRHVLTVAVGFQLSSVGDRRKRHTASNLTQYIFSQCSFRSRVAL